MRGPLRIVCVLLVLVAVAAAVPSVRAGRSGGLPRPPRVADVTTTKRGLSSGHLRDEASSGRSERLVVEVLHRLSDVQAQRRIERFGGTVRGMVPGVLVQAEMPVRNLDRLEGSDGITFVRPPKRIDAAPDAGRDAANSLSPTKRKRKRKGVGEEVAKMNATLWHAAGQRGAGVKVGIIDLFSRRPYGDAQRAKQVPAPAGTACFFFGLPCDVFSVSGSRQIHGTGVAEIVHEMAPDAQLYLASAFTAADLEAVVNVFAAQGVKIITRSLTSEYDGPGDGRGPIDAVIDHAVTSGITWFNSAGNSAGNGAFPRSGAYYRGVFTDTDGNGFHEFAPGIEALGLPCGVFTLGLRWDDFDEPSASVTDFDLFELDQNNTVLDVAADAQGSSGGTAPPLENFDRAGTTCATGRSRLVFVAIHLANAGDGASDTLEFQNNGQPMTFSSDPFSAAVPACDSANAGLVCVGSIFPALGVEVASFSSRGPTNDDRTKPDIVAASCLASFSFRGCFNGTSASSPAAAGAAALLLGAGLGDGTSEGLADLVRASVVDRDVPGPDTAAGAGELVLPPPP